MVLHCANRRKSREKIAQKVLGYLREATGLLNFLPFPVQKRFANNNKDALGTDYSSTVVELAYPPVWNKKVDGNILAIRMS